jgi:hypothetical protein
MKNYRRPTSIILLLFSLAFIYKAVSLLSIVKDGDGIGLYFLGLEINDKLPYEQIPKYSWSFLLLGLLFIFISIGLSLKSLKNKI